MDRNKLYLLKPGEGKTFDHDPNLPPLPLPQLEETMERYFESLKPFGTPAELEISRRLVDDFSKGYGQSLHEFVEIRSWSNKNWINDWWEKYRYHLLRFPLYPYIVMALPLPLQCIGIPENEDYSLKAAARCLYHKIEFWDLLHRGRIRPVAPPDGMKYFSMEMFKRFFCTTRIPGESSDRLETHFKTVSENDSPRHGIVISKGRIFQFDCVKPDESLTTVQEILRILQCIRGATSTPTCGQFVPILTCDDRSRWSKNRKHLIELSSHNARLLKILESSIIMVYFDEHSPKDYSECAQLSLTGGDFHSKWADRSTIMAVYRNGKISLIGEPSAYDARCSISFAFFLLLSLLESAEPDWNQETTPILLSPVEHIFDLDEPLKEEIERIVDDCESRRDEITVSYKSFNDYGRKWIARNGMHWDSYVQVVLQLAFYRMHQRYPSTHETILLRDYYHGRTDTLHGFTQQTVEFLGIATNPQSTRSQIFEAFKKAVTAHTEMRANVKNGHGFDRHLLALYCAAVETNSPVPELFQDPLYARSGGQRKYDLVTSTSGFTIINVFTAPLVTDGYGFFYSVTSDGINIITTAWKASTQTSAHKFSQTFCDTLGEIRSLVRAAIESKL